MDYKFDLGACTMPRQEWTRRQQNLRVQALELRSPSSTAGDAQGLVSGRGSPMTVSRLVKQISGALAPKEQELNEGERKKDGIATLGHVSNGGQAERYDARPNMLRESSF